MSGDACLRAGSRSSSCVIVGESAGQAVNHAQSFWLVDWSVVLLEVVGSSLIARLTGAHNASA